MDPDEVKFSKSVIIRFVGCVRPHLRLVVGAALMGIGKFTLPLAFPLAFKYVIDVLLTTPPKFDRMMLAIDHWCTGLSQMAGDVPTSTSKLAALSAVMLALYGLQSIASYYRNYWAGLAGYRLIFDLQRRLFSHLQRLPHSFFDRNPSGAIVSRVLNDVQQANELVGSALIDVWMDGITLILVVAELLAMDRRLALVALCIAPLWVGFMRYFSPRIKSVSHRMQESVEEIAGEIYERVAGATTIKSFCREDHEVEQFHISTQRLLERTIDKVKLSGRQEMLIQLLTRAAPTIVIWVGALMVIQGSITLGTIVAFYALLGFLYLPLERFAQLNVVVSASMAALERIFGFLDIKPEITDHALSRPHTVKSGTVQFDNVSFGYNARAGKSSRRVLEDLNLHVPGGYRVALVGRSGAGKTTMASLIPRFYEATRGRILIDGRDVRLYTLKSLRESIAVVAQDALLFSSSIRNNLLYARPDATDEMLVDALEMTNLGDFLESLPDGLDTVIGERGFKISGGQRQRLAIARAFLKDSKIVILDEATSAVDSKSENQIHEAMERLMAGRTVFLIAHRLRSAVNADMIVVLDNGHIVEKGTHAELMRLGGTYYDLYEEQARGLALPTPREAYRSRLAYQA
ncbi:MAG TPA: ABC transporter ATP-binding protein [Candidatus Binatus sp.]|nr:ABC transporter ATP-binding protein [Candidatus Binatus sp.]